MVWSLKGRVTIPAPCQLNNKFGRRRKDVSNSVESAKQVLAANEAVLYGIFGVIGSSGYFPPRDFLNDFLLKGNDPCDQDGRMSAWQPFAVSPEDYRLIKAWWMANHAGAVEDALSADCWADWVQEILNR